MNRDIIYIAQWGLCSLLNIIVIIIRANRRHPYRYTNRQGIGYTWVIVACQLFSVYQRYIGEGTGGILSICLGHVVIGTMNVGIPVRGPGLVLLLGIYALHLKNDLHMNKLPIDTHEQRYSRMDTKGSRVWFNRDKVRRIRRAMIKAHRADKGHRTVSRARFERAARIVRKEISSYFGAHLRVWWGPFFRKKNIWLIHRRHTHTREGPHEGSKETQGWICGHLRRRRGWGL